MINPPPRPALKKAADAEVHPARPARPIPLRPVSAPNEVITGEVKKPKRPSTSDTLTATKAAPEQPGKSAKKDKGKKKGKNKSAKKSSPSSTDSTQPLAPELYDRLAQKAVEHGYEPTEVIELLVRAWLDS